MQCGEKMSILSARGGSFQKQGGEGKGHELSPEGELEERALYVCFFCSVCFFFSLFSYVMHLFYLQGKTKRVFLFIYFVL